MSELSRILNLLLIFVIGGVLLGAYAYQFVLHEQPCPLCTLQRLGMIGITIGPLLNLRYGAKAVHYGISLLSAVFGGGVALRQVALHVCPGEPSFGVPVFGFSLYTWSFIVFVCATFAVSVILFTQNYVHPHKHRLNWVDKAAFALILFLTLANVVTTLCECGLGPCQG